MNRDSDATDDTGHGHSKTKRGANAAIAAVPVRSGGTVTRSWTEMSPRGQTLQDYALGIGVFLLALFFVLNTVVPSMLAPFETEAGGDVEAQAERVANTFVENASVPGQLNNLNISTVHEVAGEDHSVLQQRYRLPETSQINITVETMNGSSTIVSATGTTLRAGANLPGGESATRSRIVTLSDGSCDPACRLIVRVW